MVRGSRCRGFILLVLLFAIAGMAIALYGITETYSFLIEHEKEQELLQIGHEFRTAIQRYYSYKNLEGYPTSIEDLLKDPRDPSTVRHLRRLYSDPFFGNQDWGLIKIGPYLIGIYSKSQHRPLQQTNFEPDDADFAGKSSIEKWLFTFPPHILRRAPAQ